MTGRRCWGFLAARAIPGVETVADDRYARVVDIGGTVARSRSTDAPLQSALRVTLRIPRLDAVPAVIARVRRVFDLGADPGGDRGGARPGPALERLIARAPGYACRAPGHGFEIAVRASYLASKSRSALRYSVGGWSRRLARRPPISPGLHGFDPPPYPGPDRFDLNGEAMQDTALGATIRNAARPCRDVDWASPPTAPHTSRGLFDPRHDLDMTVARLRDCRVLANGRTQYIAMRALRESDAFLAADVALQRTFLAVDGRRPGARELP